jgi:DNA mismatch repair protein MutL
MEMGLIHQIVDYDKIAAGEVIERPASVVKELLENSIDAGADRIEIHVEEAGVKSIKVVDNGCGIEPEDAIIAFDRHTTSKIDKFEDIYDLKTLGFRGEALASIKAVARIEMVTRTKEHELGHKVVFDGDRLVEEADVPAPVGTSMTVKNLFFNVPVRRKFLKSRAVEFAHISDIVTRYALCYHEIDLKLFHDGKRVINAPPSRGNLLNKVVALYGGQHASNMFEVSEKAEEFSLHGLIAGPAITRSSRTYSSLFVNHRYIASTDVARVIEDAYHGRLMKGSYPFYVLFLDINPALIDVNIHPTKKEIKFSNEDELLGRVTEWVEAALHRSMDASIPEPVATTLDQHAETPERFTIGKPSKAGDRTPERHSSPATASAPARARAPASAGGDMDTGILEFDRKFTAALDSTEAVEARAKEAKAPGEVARLSGFQPLPIGTAAGASTIDTGIFKHLPRMEQLAKGFQLNDTYLLFSAPDGGLVIVDQHAASERVEYEKLRKKFKTSAIESQAMLVPKQLHLPPTLAGLLEENIPLLDSYGFQFEVDQNTSGDESEASIKVTRVPTVFHKELDFEIIEKFLEEVLSIKDKPIKKARDEILQLMACHTGIRAGDQLTPKRAWNLLRDLDACEDPFHCCHGRPTFVTLPSTFFDKEFKRIV